MLPTPRTVTLLVFSCALVLGPVFATGCSIGVDSSGEMENASFTYRSAQCILGCSLDHAALQGATVDVVVTDRDPNVHLRARLADAVAGRITSQEERCDCDDGSGSRTIEPNAACASGEDKTCQLTVSILAEAPAETKLEVLDGSNAVRDRVAFAVRPAARIELALRAHGTDVPLAGDAYPIEVGERVELDATMRDDRGGMLVFSSGGVSHEYADSNVLRHDPTNLLGVTDLEPMVADHAGDTSVTVKAVGAEATAKFHVTP